MVLSGRDDGRTSRAPRTTAGAGTTGQLERIAVGIVGLTARALAGAGVGIDLTFQQWRAVFVIGESDEGVRVGRVATRLGASLPAASRLLRRLETRGLLTLATDETDRRATRARLTPGGHAIRMAILDERRVVLGAIAERLGEAGVDPAPLLETIEAGLEPYI